MKTVEDRTPYYCDIARRCVILYSGTTEEGKAFRACSCVVPTMCGGCPIYEHGLGNYPRSDAAPAEDEERPIAS